MNAPPNIRDLLQGHVTLQLQSLDRLYLNGYVAHLQHGAGLGRAATSSAASSGAKASRKPSGPCKPFRRCTRLRSRSDWTDDALQSTLTSRNASVMMRLRRREGAAGLSQRDNRYR